MRSAIAHSAESPSAETLPGVFSAPARSDTSAPVPTAANPEVRPRSSREQAGDNQASTRAGLRSALSRRLSVIELRFVVGSTLLAFLLRLLLLSTVQQVISPDGVDYVLVARQMFRGFIGLSINAWTPPLYPTLIGLAATVVGDGELAGRLVSVVAGSLLVMPVYVLARHAYGRRTASWAAVLTALHPLLIYYSTQVLTEATYTFCFICAVFAGWLALSTRRARWFVLTGLAFAACYLVRAEAFGFILLMLALTLASGLVHPRVPKKTLLVNCAALAVGFLLVAGPYLVHLRLENGYWMISGKLHAHLWRGHGGLSEASGSSTTNPLFPGVSVIFSRVVNAVRYEFEVFNLAFPPTFVLIAGLGLFRRRWNRIRAWRELYLFSFVAAALAGYAVTVPNIRFVIPLLAILLCWLAKGLVEFEGWALESLARIKRARRFLPAARRLVVPIVVAALLGSLLPLFVYLLRGEKWGDYQGQKRAGGWIKETARRGGPGIMSTVPITPFYAEGRHVPLVDQTPAELVERARSEDVSFVIINERSLKNMSLRQLLDERNQYPGLRLVHTVTEAPGHKILVYEVISAEQVTPQEPNR